ncbi:hypothetical protein EMGBS1_05400 [Chloroflexota bacterium]|nr:hypothetical protein EMGBS1_05400 [Chloroflexota bacterium]
MTKQHEESIALQHSVQKKISASAGRVLLNGTSPKGNISNSAEKINDKWFTRITHPAAASCGRRCGG